MHKTGEKKAYYRLKTERKIDFNQFVDRISSHNSGISRGEAIRVLMHATDTLAELLAEGYSVTIDEMGTFKATVGLVEDKEMDSFEEGTPKLNARSLRIDGVNFQADKKLIVNVDKRCELKRAGVSKLRRSPFTKEDLGVSIVTWCHESEALHGTYRPFAYGGGKGTARVRKRRGIGHHLNRPPCRQGVCKAHGRIGAKHVATKAIVTCSFETLLTCSILLVFAPKTIFDQ